MDVVVAELISFLQVVRSGSWIGYVILLVSVLIGLAWITAGLVYRRILNERRQTTSQAKQEIFKATAAELRKRALKMKHCDDDLWKREQEVARGDEPEAVLEDTELRSKREQSPQQHALKEQLKQSVGYTITIGFKDRQEHLLQSNLRGLLMAAQKKRKRAA
jgi:hypothetical protein